MKVENLTLSNFNNRKFKVETYTQEQNDKLVESNHPLIIILPGGSFNHYAKREGEPVALAYASKGYNCAVMYYNLVQDPGKVYPDAALSGLSLISYYRKNAEKYHIDTNKIVVCGFSAGGHVASAIDLFAHNSDIAKVFKYDEKDVAPNAEILGYPLIDVMQIGFPLTPEQIAAFPKEKYICNTSLGVTSKTSPTFIFQTWDDPTVKITNSIEYIEALNANHVKFEAHLFDRGGHGYSLATKELVTKGNEWQDNFHVAHWFELSIEWLNHML